MTTQTTSLAAWLLAQIEADEAAADECHNTYECSTVGPVPYPCDCGLPARVLAQCAAHRRIVELHSAEGQSGIPHCATCLSERVGFSDDWGPDPWPCDTLRALAAVYAGRDGYDPSWAL